MSDIPAQREQVEVDPTFVALSFRQMVELRRAESELMRQAIWAKIQEEARSEASA